MNYQSALLQIKNRESKKLERNTYLIKDGDNLAVRLHKTNIITFTPSGDAIYKTGGWHTVTTRDRMNKFGLDGYYIQQEKGVWYLIRHNSKKDIWNEKLKIFDEDLTIKPNGKILNGLPIGYSKTIDRKKKAINNYCKKFVEKFVSGNLNKPSAGDCFYCGMVTTDENKPLGEAMKDAGHIEAHIKENYFVPSLLLNACKMFRPSPIVCSMIGLWLEKDKREFVKNAWGTDIAKDQISKSLKKYINLQLNGATNE